VVLAQNQLGDVAYNRYIWLKYGKKIHTPTLMEMRNAFEDYTTDATLRYQEHQPMTGENIHTLTNGVIHVTGPVSVMAVDGLLARQIFFKNQDRQFYIEEGFPLNWTFPYLSPHGLILQMHNEPVAEVSEAEVGKDMDYWGKLAGEMIGNWLTNGTSLEEVCDFGDKTFFDGNMDGFKGDAAFVKNRLAQVAFSKSRCMIGVMYSWRAQNARTNDERSRMRRAADMAFRQSFALCPYSPEIVADYGRFLLENNRPDDAILIAKTALHFDSENAVCKQVIELARKSEMQNGSPRL
jgi:hypothetical protein